MFMYSSYSHYCEWELRGRYWTFICNSDIYGGSSRQIKMGEKWFTQPKVNNSICWKRGEGTRLLLLLLFVLSDGEHEAEFIVHSTWEDDNTNLTLNITIQMNLKHFCLSWGIRVLKRIESARNWVLSSGMYPNTWKVVK